MTHRAKLVMMVEATISLLTVGLVAARAVNILARGIWRRVYRPSCGTVPTGARHAHVPSVPSAPALVLAQDDRHGQGAGEAVALVDNGIVGTLRQQE